MPGRDAFLALTVLFPVLLSCAHAHSGFPGLLYVGGGLGLGLALWWRQRSQMRQALAEQAQTHGHERGTLHQQLAEQQQAYQALQAARTHDDQTQQGWFISMSQELRMPLNTIIGYSEMLQEEYSQMAEEGLRADVYKLHDASQQLRRLIRDIQDLAKMAAGTMEVCHETFDITAAIEEALVSLRPLMQARGHTCELALSPGLGMMWADRPKFRRSLENMLRHACLLATQKTFVVWARCETTPQGESLVLHLGEVDTRGHTACVAPQSPASASDRSDSLQRYDGTGLGLVVSQRLCRLMGGELTFTGAGPEELVGAMRLPRQMPLPTGTVGQTLVDELSGDEKSGAALATGLCTAPLGQGVRHVPEPHSTLS